MMNQYTDRMSRSVSRMSRPDGSLPMHRPVSRNMPIPRSGGGNCGCGMGQAPVRSAPSPHGAPLPTCGDKRSCGCNGRHEHSGEGACQKLLQQLQAVDFALYETVLYLDVYPHSCDALETYAKLKAQHDALYREYEAACGPLTVFGNQSTTSWDWMSKPFPWEYDAE